MNIHLDNVNLSANNGPNSFAKKFVKYALKNECSFDRVNPPDAYLTFIETQMRVSQIPLVQRLDGIYYNTRSNYSLLNQNIKRTYKMASGVVFQSEYGKRLVSKFFGEHHNGIIIHNGADIDFISQVHPLTNPTLDKFEKVWVCAAAWRPHKRLSENLKYFLEHSSDRECLVVAGDTPKQINHPRVFFVGTLQQQPLLALYKRADIFLHLAWLDCCPNVVVDARAAGCKIICSSSGGTPEIAGPDATIILEEEWGMEPIDLYNPPAMDFTKNIDNSFDVSYNMNDVAKKYRDFIKTTIGKAK